MRERSGRWEDSGSAREVVATARYGRFRPGRHLTIAESIPSLLGMDLRGHLDLMLLSGLRDLDTAHGYALIANLRDRSDGVFDLPEGTVYPALHRLERDGLIASEWDTSAPRRRRVYHLTPTGAAALSAKRGEWQVFARGMQALMGPGIAEGMA